MLQQIKEQGNEIIKPADNQRKRLKSMSETTANNALILNHLAVAARHLIFKLYLRKNAKTYSKRLIHQI